MVRPRLDRIASVYLTKHLPWQSDALPILMYHGISDEPEPGVSPYFQVRTPPSVLREHMRQLVALGYKGVDLETALSQPGERLVAITFDDGFANLHREAYPILQESGFTASVFLPTAHIGDHRKPFQETECLTWHEVRELHQAGWRFGSHTVNHPQLRDCTWKQIAAELTDSRSVIEDNLSAPVTSFAYPFAFPQADQRFVAQLRDHLTRAGYEISVTTKIGRASQPVRPEHFLPRLPINGLDDPRLFVSKLSGAYDWMAGAQTAAKTGKRLLRR